MAGSSLVAWLRGPPKSERVAVFRCTTPDGVKNVRVSATSARPWADAARAIEALETSKIEALGKNGDVIRVTNIESADDETAAAAVEAKTPRESEMVLVARLIADAHIRSAEIMRAANGEAFEALLGLTKTAFQRLDMMEKAWTRALGKQIRDAGGDGEDGDEPISLAKMMESFIGGRMQAEFAKAAAGGGAAPPATNGTAHTNGAAPPKE